MFEGIEFQKYEYERVGGIVESLVWENMRHEGVKKKIYKPYFLPNSLFHRLKDKG